MNIPIFIIVSLIFIQTLKAQDSSPAISTIAGTYDGVITLSEFKRNKKIVSSNENVKIIGFTYLNDSNYYEKLTIKSDTLPLKITRFIEYKPNYNIQHYFYNIKAVQSNDTIILNNITFRLNIKRSIELNTNLEYKATIGGICSGIINKEYLIKQNGIYVIPKSKNFRIKKFQIGGSYWSCWEPRERTSNKFIRKDYLYFDRLRSGYFLFLTNITAIDKSGDKYRLPPIIVEIK